MSTILLCFCYPPASCMPSIRLSFIYSSFFNFIEVFIKVWHCYGLNVFPNVHVLET